MKSNRRKIVLINSKFQGRFILRFTAATTMWSVAAVSLFAYVAGKRMQDELYRSHLSITSSGDLLVPATLYAHAISLVLLLVLLAYTVHSLWKKLATPLYMLKKDVIRVASGDLVSEVVLREKDEFQDLASDINEMRRSLQRHFLNIQEHQSALTSSVADLQRDILTGNRPSNQVQKIKEAAARMKEELAGFTY